MKESRIIPEKITHPLQLMAAWFVMLILLVGILLAGASKIQQPTWVSGFLVISSIVLSLLVIFLVFIMLTKYRPHLQDAKEYADWLKDERRFRGQKLKGLSLYQDIHHPPAGVPKTHRIINDVELFLDIARHPVEIADIEGSDEVLGSLRKLGFNAQIYKEESDSFETEHFYEQKDQSDGIWLGVRVSPKVALIAIKTTIEIWPHLKFIHISIDGGGPPDYIHDQLFFGGATSTALEYGCKPWRNDEIQSISEDIDMLEFHKLIRSKYS